MDNNERLQFLLALKVALQKTHDAALNGQCDSGLCSEVGSRLGINHAQDWELYAYEVFQQWAGYTGSIVYPVSGGWSSYHFHRNCGTLWDKSISEGQRRWKLLEFLILRVDLDIANWRP